MSTVEQSIDQLIDEIKHSKDYMNYVAAKKEIKQIPEKETVVNAYRKANFEFQSMSDGEHQTSEADALAETFRSLVKDPVIERYLAAELAMCRLMQEINYKLVAELDFELGF